MAKRLNVSYWDRLLIELEQIRSAYVEVMRSSGTVYSNPNSYGHSGVVFLGAADYSWLPSTPEVESRRMSLLASLRDWKTRFELLFPHPTPAVAKRHDKAFEHLQRWLMRPDKSDHFLKADIEQMTADLEEPFETLRSAKDLLQGDEYPNRLTVDTNALIDNPDVALYQVEIGKRYMVHVLPVVLRELDDLKRSGRTEELRDAARRADRRLKGYRSNGDITQGVRVAGEVHVRFEHIEPAQSGLPSWIDLSVPDDRFVASTLLLQSQHPGSLFTVVTSDLNLQTKLSAVGLPYIEGPSVAAPTEE